MLISINKLKPSIEAKHLKRIRVWYESGNGESYNDTFLAALSWLKTVVPFKTSGLTIYYRAQYVTPIKLSNLIVGKTYILPTINPLQSFTSSVDNARYFLRFIKRNNPVDFASTCIVGYKPKTLQEVCNLQWIKLCLKKLKAQTLPEDAVKALSDLQALLNESHIKREDEHVLNTGKRIAVTLLFKPKEF